MSIPIGNHSLKNGQGMGVAARGNLIDVAAGMMRVQVYSFPDSPIDDTGGDAPPTPQHSATAVTR